jgi:hypothetical protein
MPTLALRTAGVLVLVSIVALASPAEAIWMGDYLPAHGPSYWTYVNREHPFDSYTDAVFDTASFGGIDGVKFGEPDEYNIVHNTGSVVTVPAVFEHGFLIDIEPDIVLGWIEDGDPFVICNPVECDTNLVRIWQAIDPALQSLYGLDPVYDDIVLIVSYDADYPPNLQNTVAASNLPDDVDPPAGAVTGLEWYQRGVGMIATANVLAETGGLEDFYDLTDWYVGIMDQGLPPANVVLHPARPNPFNARTVIAFDLQQAGSVRLDVVDVLGRSVRTILSADLAAGSHTVDWNGRARNGERAASGTYFARLRSAGRTWVRPVSLVQ